MNDASWYLSIYLHMCAGARAGGAFGAGPLQPTSPCQGGGPQRPGRRCGQTRFSKLFEMAAASPAAAAARIERGAAARGACPASSTKPSRRTATAARRTRAGPCTRLHALSRQLPGPILINHSFKVRVTPFHIAKLVVVSLSWTTRCTTPNGTQIMDLCDYPHRFPSLTSGCPAAQPHRAADRRSSALARLDAASTA